MVVGGAGLTGVEGGLGGVVVCPERKEANKRNAAASRINGDSPRGSKNFRIQDEDEESRAGHDSRMRGFELGNQYG
jgi:hypothetical protein